ncbi:hypothetical protein MN116_004259 [Schistosoma mekongi]|uniref:protein-tyrosine-phosphatase n=1 Tax=Schistosoma mekongi TaxID=38744 RepID=A0AAE1ZG63_SCHME|nr:hypothetical protein MN116_004259 [Schistosoma mekongi]
MDFYEEEIVSTSTSIDNKSILQSSTNSYDHWILNDSLHSPWPTIEVNQLAYLINQMKPVFSKSQHTLSCSTHSISTNSTSSKFLNTNDDQLNMHSNNRLNHVVQNVNDKQKLLNHKKNYNLSKLKILHNHLVIIDCRYPYEFNAGHIYHAINLFDWPQFYEYFFGVKQSIKTTNTTFKRLTTPVSNMPIQPKPSNTLFVLHCEYSTKRAPELFLLLRNYDRTLHFNSYPAIKYPFVYILHGGYAAFYKEYPNLCEPSSYLQMHSRPDLLSIWRKHCNLVNKQSTNYILQSYEDNHSNSKHPKLNTNLSFRNIDN